MNLKNPKYNPFFISDYYIFEYSAVPREVRNKFRDRLMRRKGAAAQKNIMLINLLDDLTREKSPDEKLSISLNEPIGVTKRMLDCHKARLIKNLREFCFGWVDITGESAMGKIRRRFAKGMLREARSELLTLEDEILASGKQRVRLPELFEISEKLIQIYNYLKDKRRSNHYYKLSGVYQQKIKKSFLKNEIKDDIMIRYQLIQTVKLMANRFKVDNLQKAVKILEKILLRYGDSLDAQHRMKIYHRLGLLYNVLRDKNRSLNAFEQGKDLAFREGHTAEALVFESYLFLRKFTENNKLAPEALKFHRDNFGFITVNYTDVQQLMDFEFNYCRFLIFSGGEETEIITEDFVSKQILFSRKAEALNSWYLELSDQLSSNVYQFSAAGNNFNIQINNAVLNELTELNRMSVSRFSGLFSPNALVILYVNIAEQEFWKGKEADFELAENYIKKTQRFTKLYYINISGSWVSSTKLGLKIFEMLATESNERVYRKYKTQILKFTETIQSEKQSFNIASDLAKLIFIASSINSEELNRLLSELLEQIRIKQPEVLSSLIG